MTISQRRRFGSRDTANRTASNGAAGATIGGGVPLAGHHHHVHPAAPQQQHQQQSAAAPPFQPHRIPGGAATYPGGKSATQPQRLLNPTLRAIVVFVVWNVMLSARFFLMSDSSFPLEALLPFGYGALCIFLQHDEFRLWSASLVFEAALVSVLSLLVLDLPMAEVLIRAALLINVFQWCQLRLAVGGIAACAYLAQVALSAPPVSDPRHPIIAIAVHATMGISIALILKTNRLLRGPRVALQGRIDGAIDRSSRFVAASPVLSAIVNTVDRYFATPLLRVLTSRALAEIVAWWTVMFVDWYEQVSIGGLAITACLLVGFGASLVQDHSSGRTRYAYQLLLVVAVWASDVSVFLAAPVKALPFVANSVVSAYFVLYCAAPSFSPPKIATRAVGSTALEITPIAPKTTSVVFPVLLWILMVCIDFYVQARRGWREPTLGRVILYVNTIGYGVLMLMSTFLDSFSRDARIRARMSYLEESSVSPDTVALRQLCDDLEGTRELDLALAAAGIDLREVNDGRCTTLFLSSATPVSDSDYVAGHGAATPHDTSALDGAGGAGAAGDDPSAAVDSESTGAVSEASTTAHSAHPAASGKSTPAQQQTPVGSNQGSFAQPLQPQPQTTAPTPLPLQPLDGRSGAGQGATATPEVPKETPEEAAARERARREADEARKRLKLQQKQEAQRQQQQRQAALAEAREAQRRELQRNDVLDAERRERDSIASKERNARDKSSAAWFADGKSIAAALKARKERDERLQRQAAREKSVSEGGSEAAAGGDSFDSAAAEVPPARAEQHQRAAEQPADKINVHGKTSKEGAAKPAAAAPAAAETQKPAGKGAQAVAPSNNNSKQRASSKAPAAPEPAAAASKSGQQSAQSGRSTQPSTAATPNVASPAQSPVKPAPRHAANAGGMPASAAAEPVAPVAAGGKAKATRPAASAPATVQKQQQPAEKTPKQPQPRSATAAAVATPPASRPGSNANNTNVASKHPHQQQPAASSGKPAPNAAAKPVKSPVVEPRAALPTAPPLAAATTTAGSGGGDGVRQSHELIGKLLASLKSPENVAAVAAASDDRSSYNTSGALNGSGVAGGSPLGSHYSASAALTGSQHEQDRGASAGAGGFMEDDEADTWNFISNQVQSVLDDGGAAAISALPAASNAQLPPSGGSSRGDSAVQSGAPGYQHTHAFAPADYRQATATPPVAPGSAFASFGGAGGAGSFTVTSGGPGSDAGGAGRAPSMSPGPQSAHATPQPHGMMVYNTSDTMSGVSFDGSGAYMVPSPTRHQQQQQPMPMQQQQNQYVAAHMQQQQPQQQQQYVALPAYVGQQGQQYVYVNGQLYMVAQATPSMMQDMSAMYAMQPPQQQGGGPMPQYYTMQ